ncbi:hypothetical protein [Blattabacterium cuenoti]|uniref:hypothetical protein n=1 Tax=Blattabacterium cuenoti TaxID=1653831 RepID=UPI001FCAFB78|nr:hypothetical protein [Blattabacterium cuenoti]
MIHYHNKIDLYKIQKFLNQNKTVDVIVRNPSWIEEPLLSINMKKIFLFLKKGKISHPYKEIINGKEAFIIIKLLDEIPSKPVSFEKDYDILKNLVKDIKKKERIKNWAKKILKSTYYIKMNCSVHFFKDSLYNPA